MRLLSSVAAAAVLAFAAPALAQEAAPAPQAPAAAPAEADSPEEVAFEARADAFGKSMEAMQGELQTAAAQEDKAKAKTDMDAIQARYQPEADAFVSALQTFAAAQGAPADQIAAAAQQIGAIPSMMRAEVEQKAAAPVAAPATPQ